MVDLDTTVERSVARTWDEVPAYPASRDESLRPDLRAHTRAVFDAVLATMRAGRRAGRDDFRSSVDHARHRVRQGVALADFMQGFRIGQETLWEAIVAAAKVDAETRLAALDLAIHVMNVIEVGSSVAAETYMIAQQMELADDDLLRRDLMEDLLAARELTSGPKAELAAASGLADASSIVVVVAVPTVALRADQSLREVVSAVRTSIGTGQQGIAVLRQDHVVGITPVHDEGTELAKGLERAHHSLSRRGIHLGVGVSTVHSGLHGVPAARREAVLARKSLAGEPGVRPLTELSPLDYLVLLDDPTAQRLITPLTRSFIEDDLRQAGALIETIRLYAACDLNAKAAAERLHVHVNTVYYRLERISERTGCDLRSFADFQNLLVAARLLARPTSDRGQAPGATAPAGEITQAAGGPARNRVSTSRCPWPAGSS
ncbi:CdaR family transcriptional regulator [Saccharopolyspora gloriosae]|uniref:PucR family transcriptional regulator n=1 Tax=Saccharopolyspora gloriosae TaxID=455344 RepID=UPI001FB743ED|nr:helix-turn-helix domain-containing protein [Saccharopolyspora gloriosae]